MVEIGVGEAEKLRGDGRGIVALAEEGLLDALDGFFLECLLVVAVAELHEIRVTPLAEVIQAHISHIVEAVQASEVAVLRKVGVYCHDFILPLRVHRVAI